MAKNTHAKLDGLHFLSNLTSSRYGGQTGVNRKLAKLIKGQSDLVLKLEW